MNLGINSFETNHLNLDAFPFLDQSLFGREDSLGFANPSGKRKQSQQNNGLWDIATFDLLCGGLESQPTAEVLEPAPPPPKISPPAKRSKQQRAAAPEVMPVDGDFFGHGGESETAESKLDRIRAKNRMAQERFRAKKKAEEKAMQDQMNRVKTDIAKAQQEVGLKKQMALSLGARGVAASTQLAHVHSQLSQLSVNKYASRMTHAPQDVPARVSVPLTAWVYSKQLQMNPDLQPGPAQFEPYMPVLENTCSPIFQVESALPRPCDSFRYQERISLRHISTVPGSSTLARAKHYKATVAHGLGCKVSDICWRMDSVRVPELTGPEGMSTHFGSVECAPKHFLSFICTLLEFAGSLIILGRLEQDRDMAALDPSPFQGVSRLPYPGEGGAGADDDDNMFSSGMGLDPITEVPGPVEWSSPAETGGEAQTELLALSLFPKLLNSYISRMHPDDAARFLVHLVALVQHFHAPEEDQKLDEFTTLVNSKLFAIMKSLDAAVQHAQLGLSSKAAYVPLPREATLQEIAAVHRTLKEATAEWHFTVLMAQMDAGRQIRTMALQICNPVGSGYVKFEEQNVKAYAAVNMSSEQKQELAFVWNVFKQETAQVAAARDAICQHLAALPSHRDLHVEDMRAMKTALTALLAADRAEAEGGAAPLADANKGVKPEAVSGDCGWVRKLIGVSPEVTEVAEKALASLRDIQSRSTELFSEIGEVYMNVLSPKQNAIWMTVLMPSLGDTFRIAEMATTDVRQQRMFSDNIRSIVHNPASLPGELQSVPLLYPPPRLNVAL